MNIENFDTHFKIIKMVNKLSFYWFYAFKKQKFEFKLRFKDIRDFLCVRAIVPTFI